MEREANNWRGTPLDIEDTIDPYGIEEVVIEFENGDYDAFRSRLRDRFYSYELHQLGTYLDSIAHEMRKSEKR